MKTPVHNVEGLPVSRLPFSSGIIAEGRFLFVSGQGPYDPAVGSFVRGSVAEQTTLTLECIRRIIEAAGAGMSDVVSCGCSFSRSRKGPSPR